MNEINYITLKRHGWTDKLIEKFNLHPISYNIKTHKPKFDNSVVIKIESSQEFRDELIKIQKEKNLKKTVPQLKKIFQEMLFDKIEDDKFFGLKCLYHDSKSENEKYAENYIKEMNKYFESFRIELCTKIKQCETVEDLSLLAKEMDNLHGEHFSDYL